MTPALLLLEVHVALGLLLEEIGIGNLQFQFMGHGGLLRSSILHEPGKIMLARGSMGVRRVVVYVGSCVG